jgi:hypothetical protein
MDPFRCGAAGREAEARQREALIVVISAKPFRTEHVAELTTPSAALSVASQLFIDAAATPPFQGGEMCQNSN